MSHVSFNPGQNEYFFSSFHPMVKIYLQRPAADFIKMFFEKSKFRMQLQDYIKIIMLDLTNRRIKKFNFKRFKQSYWLQLIQ